MQLPKAPGHRGHANPLGLAFPLVLPAGEGPLVCLALSVGNVLPRCGLLYYGFAVTVCLDDVFQSAGVGGMGDEGQQDEDDVGRKSAMLRFCVVVDVSV